MDISDLRESITEARNVIIYGSHFPYKPKEYVTKKEPQDDKGVLNALLEYMHESCTYIFAETKLEFFGPIRPEKPESISLPPLRGLDSRLGFINVWKKMLNYHCLLTTYDKLHNIIFHNQRLEGYGLSRHINNCGLDYSRKENNFRLYATDQNEYIINDGEKNCNYGVVGSDKASNEGRNSYPNSFNTLTQLFDKYNNYSYISNQITISESNGKPTKCSIPISMLPLLNNLRGQGNLLKNILKLYDSRQNITANMKKFHLSVKELEESIERTQDYFTRMDILYYKYQLEKTFHLDFAYCLTKNIEKLSKRLKRPLNDDSFIDFVSSSINLPNVFSRHLLIQMAFDCCTEYHDFNSSFLIRQVLNPDSIASFDRRINKVTNSFDMLSQWQNRYRDFINYMVEFALPMYESYFFVSLYDYYAAPEDSAAQTALKLYDILNVYLSSDEVFNSITTDYLVNESIDACSKVISVGTGTKDNTAKLSRKDFILPDYSNFSVNENIFRKVILSTYNHLPEPTPVLISQEYFNNNFKRMKQNFINSCTAELLSN